MNCPIDGCDRQIENYILNVCRNCASWVYRFVSNTIRDPTYPDRTERRIYKAVSRYENLGDATHERVEAKRALRTTQRKARAAKKTAKKKAAKRRSKAA